MAGEETAIGYLNENYKRFSKLARDIWEHPEVGLEETFASKAIADELDKAGFAVEFGAGGMETAFVASWGEGSPIIGILGEYDALPSLSQDATPERNELVPGGPGHGCGHNLYGVGALGAALAMQEAMKEQGITGTVRYYGCPAEETLTGKTYMARDGVFDDLDASITWHPGYANTVPINSSSLAMNSFKVHFHGVASHAAAVPHMGRSALDGAMLMDIGVNYLREHIIQDARIHSVIKDGGEAPNVVPPTATIWYYVRAPKRDQVESIYQRMLDCAKGAALMSGTTYEVEFLTGCYEMLPNATVSNIMLDKMEQLGGIEFSHDDMEFARKLQESISPEIIEMSREQTLKNSKAGTTADDIGDVLCENVIRPSDEFHIGHGSTEVADVSQITPTANMWACCHPLGSPGHSWQITASSGAEIGFKGMDFAAKSMALTGLELMVNKEAVETARREFTEATGGRKYVTPLPEGATPQKGG
ncbi:MAG TPA: amidohydrolase [Thermomicrobiales bacterium]|nr:amidohydrolase [Thermomicrobiales bacterium]